MRKEYQKEYYQKNKEKLKQRRIKRYYENTEAEKEYMKGYRKTKSYKNKAASYQEKFYAKPGKKDERNKTRQISNNKPENKLIRSLRRGLWGALNGRQKTSHTMDYVGKSPEELLDYLSKYFQKGMTKNNQGKKWHIDHIIPASFFDHNDELQIKLCWHYTNLYRDHSRFAGCRCP